MTIKVIDAPCGRGKTSWAIQEMNRNINSKFIFVTPFIKEVRRIKAECSERHFKEPETTKGKTKSADLKRLLEHSENIVSTHALFARSDEEIIELIRMGGYKLILDEVMGVVSDEPIKKDDLKMLRDQGHIQINEDGIVSAEDAEYKGRFDDIIMSAKMNRLIFVNDSMLLWQFPVDVFGAFEDVTILTYMFDGQYQKYYYDYHDVGYQRNSVAMVNESYELMDYTPDDDKELRDRLKQLINIYEGSLNSIGKKDGSLSVTAYGKYSKPVLKQIKNNTQNYLRNKVGGKSSDNMWTSFKAQEKALSGKGYTNGFVQHRERATNEYQHKSNLAYMINKFARVPLKSYFNTKGIKINEDHFALSELIQWVWRSRIRNDQPINLYIPSSRMRNLLKDWINGELLAL